MFKTVLLAVALTISSYTPQVLATVSPTLIKLPSTKLETTRDIHIRLPKNYGKNNQKRYPLLITLNDKDNFYWAAYIVDYNERTLL